MKVLVVGGAGYIGGTTAQQFQEAGHDVTVVDDLSTGHAHNIPGLRLEQFDAGDAKRLGTLLKQIRPDAVLDFAAKIRVDESVARPKLYFDHNTVSALTIIDEAVKVGVKAFILSSTAAVYGNPEHLPIDEASPIKPLNPYGMSKFLTENLLHSYELTHNLNWTAFRYFNAAGASGRIGPEYPFRTHLLPSVIHAQQKNQPVKVFGTDYPTPDGTCVRDYIHVVDIARAHLVAAERMVDGQQVNRSVNLGTGHGYSVREIIAEVEKASGRTVKIKEAGRRPGDSAELVASSDLAKELFGWEPEHRLQDIVRDALEWQLKYQPATHG